MGRELMVEARVSEARRLDWTLATFLPWEAAQSARFELVDGRQPRLMTGGTQAHALIAGNIIAGLKPGLRGSPCRPTGSDPRVVTGTGNVRDPDALVDCGPFRPDSHDVSEPVAVFEVLSRSTAWTDLYAKLRDYDATPTIRLYAVIAQDGSHVAVWRRDPSGSLAVTAAITAPDAVLELDAAPGAALRLADISDGRSELLA